MKDKEKINTDGFIRKINRETDFFAIQCGSAVIVCEVVVSTRKAEEIQSNPIDWIDPVKYGYQFSRMEEGGKAIFFPLS